MGRTKKQPISTYNQVLSDKLEPWWGSPTARLIQQMFTIGKKSDCYDWEAKVTPEISSEGDSKIGG